MTFDMVNTILNILILSSIIYFGSQLIKYKVYYSMYTNKERRFSVLVNSIKDYAIFILDTSGNVITWNAGAQRIKGYTENEVIGKNFRIFYPGEDQVRGWPEQELQMAREKGVCEDEGWRVRKDGCKFWANVVITALHDEEGKLIGFGKVTKDLSERKQKEEYITQLNLALETRLEAAEAFNQCVCHDLNAPLRSIDGFSEILEQDYKTTVDKQGQDYINRIRRSVSKMRQLIQDMLRLTRITQLQTDLELKPFSLSNAFRMVFSETQMADPTRQVDIKVSSDDMMVHVDPDLIGLVIGNLVSNAWKFTKHNPQPIIEVGYDTVNGEKVYYIRDNGVGFEQSKADVLFQPFKRLHSDKEFEGSGIGLTIVKRVIELHKGRVWAEGVVGKGATFYFTIGT
jgi:PAS domain S-box-containing protein